MGSGEDGPVPVSLSHPGDIKIAAPAAFSSSGDIISDIISSVRASAGANS